MTLALKGYEYLMNETLSRIKSGKSYDINFKPYTKEFLVKSLKYFESKEEYEQCKILSDFINKRFDHELCYVIHR